jgi:hypothetical protein
MPGIGPTLREARIHARVDMAEVEDQTKIRAKHLRAIENEEWDLLPEPVCTMLLRAYADYLGLDSRMLVEEFKRRYEKPAEDMRPRREFLRGYGHRLRAAFAERGHDWVRYGHRLRAALAERGQDWARYGHRLRVAFVELGRAFLRGCGRLRAAFVERVRVFLRGCGRLRAALVERGQEWVILGLGLAAAVALGALLAGLR